MFKSIDKRFEELGFIKVREDKHGVTYERHNAKYNYTHVLAILHKASGNHLIQSYDKELFDEQHIGNTCVGLTYQEAKLAVKKLRQLGYHRKRKDV